MAIDVPIRKWKGAFLEGIVGEPHRTRFVYIVHPPHGRGARRRRHGVVAETLHVGSDEVASVTCASDCYGVSTTPFNLHLSVSRSASVESRFVGDSRTPYPVTTFALHFIRLSTAPDLSFAVPNAFARMGRPNPELDMMQEAKEASRRARFRRRRESGSPSQACSVQLAKNKKKLLAVPLSLVGREKTRGETNKKATAARTRGPCRFAALDIGQRRNVCFVRVACGRFGLYRVLNLHLQDQCLEIHASEADAGAPALYTIRLEGAKLTVNGVNKFTIKSPSESHPCISLLLKSTFSAAEKTFYFRPKTEAECSQWLCALHQVTGLVR